MKVNKMLLLVAKMTSFPGWAGGLLVVRNRKHRNCFGTIVEIITSSSSPFQHCSFHDEMKENVFFPLHNTVKEFSRAHPDPMSSSRLWPCLGSCCLQTPYCPTLYRHNVRSVMFNVCSQLFSISCSPIPGALPAVPQHCPAAGSGFTPLLIAAPANELAATSHSWSWRCWGAAE